MKTVFLSLAYLLLSGYLFAQPSVIKVEPCGKGSECFTKWEDIAFLTDHNNDAYTGLGFANLNTGTYRFFNSLYPKSKPNSLSIKNIHAKAGPVNTLVIAPDDLPCYFLGKGATYMQGWQISQSRDSSLVMAYYPVLEKRRYTGKPERVNVYLFDSNLTKLSNRYLEMPYDDLHEDVVRLSVDKQGNIYTLLRVHDNPKPIIITNWGEFKYHYEVAVYAPNGDKPVLSKMTCMGRENRSRYDLARIVKRKNSLCRLLSKY